MLLILCGKSGSGKDTLQNYLVEHNQFIPIISTTTRPRRDNEVDGKDYHFVSEEKFMEMLTDFQFVEYRSYNTNVNGNRATWYYGSPIEKFESNKDYIVILDVDGARNYINFYTSQRWFNQDILILYLDVDDNIRKERAKARAGFDEKEWNRRLKDDTVKFSMDSLMKLLSPNVELVICHNDCEFEHLLDEVLDLL